MPPTVAMVLGPLLSCSLPANTSVTANTAIAAANIPSIWNEAAPYPSESDKGLVNIENAYTEPRASCISSAPATTIHLFMTFFSDILSLRITCNRQSHLSSPEQHGALAQVIHSTEQLQLAIRHRLPDGRAVVLEEPPLQ